VPLCIAASPFPFFTVILPALNVPPRIEKKATAAGGLAFEGNVATGRPKKWHFMASCLDSKKKETTLRQIDSLPAFTNQQGQHEPLDKIFERRELFLRSSTKPHRPQ